MNDNQLKDGHHYELLDGLCGYDVYVRGHKPKLSADEANTIFDVVLLAGEYDRLKRRVVDCNQ